MLHLLLAAQHPTLLGVGSILFQLTSTPFLHQKLLEVLFLEAFGGRTGEDSGGQDVWRRGELLEEGVDHDNAEFEPIFGHWSQQLSDELGQLGVFLLPGDIQCVFLSQNGVEVLGALAALGLCDQILVAGTERPCIKQQLIQEYAKVPCVHLIDIRQGERGLEEQIRAVIPVPALIAEGQGPQDWLLIDCVKEQSKGNGDLLAFIKKKVLQLHLLQQAVTAAQIPHQFHQIDQEVGDLKFTQPLSALHQCLHCPLISPRNHEECLSFLEDLENGRDYFGVERSIECEDAIEVVGESVYLQDWSGKVADVIETALLLSSKGGLTSKFTVVADAHEVQVCALPTQLEYCATQPSLHPLQATTHPLHTHIPQLQQKNHPRSAAEEEDALLIARGLSQSLQDLRAGEFAHHGLPHSLRRQPDPLLLLGLLRLLLQFISFQCGGSSRQFVFVFFGGGGEPGEVDDLVVGRFEDLVGEGLHGDVA